MCPFSGQTHRRTCCRNSLCPLHRPRAVPSTGSIQSLAYIPCTDSTPSFLLEDRYVSLSAPPGAGQSAIPIRLHSYVRLKGPPSSSLTSLPPSLSLHLGLTWIIQDNLSHLKILNRIISANLFCIIQRFQGLECGHYSGGCYSAHPKEGCREPPR